MKTKLEELRSLISQGGLEESAVALHKYKRKVEDAQGNQNLNSTRANCKQSRSNTKSVETIYEQAITKSNTNSSSSEEEIVNTGDELDLEQTH